MICGLRIQSYELPRGIIADVNNQLGHHSVKLTLDIYYHWIPDKKKAEVDELDFVGTDLQYAAKSKSNHTLLDTICTLPYFSTKKGLQENPETLVTTGGADETRTRDLRRDMWGVEGFGTDE